MDDQTEPRTDISQAPQNELNNQNEQTSFFKKYTPQILISLVILGFILFMFRGHINRMILQAQYEDNTPQEVISSCQNGGGNWTVFSNGCGDSCSYKFPSENDVPICTTAFTWACSCPNDLCWDGETCISEEEYKKTIVSTTQPSPTFVPYIFRKKKQLPYEYQQDFKSLLSNPEYTSLENDNLVQFACTEVYRRTGPQDSFTQFPSNDKYYTLIQDYTSSHEDKYVQAFIRCNTRGESRMDIILLSEQATTGGGANLYNYSSLMKLDGFTMEKAFNISENTDIRGMSCLYPLALTKENELYTICAHAGKALTKIDINTETIEVLQLER